MHSKMKKIRKRSFSTSLDSWLLNLSQTGRSGKQAVSILVDAVLVVLSLWAAYSLRLSTFFSDFSSNWHLFVLLTPFTIAVIASLGIYRWMIRSSDRRLFYQLAKACLLSALALAVFSFLFPPERANARSVFIIYGVLLTFGTISVRFLWQGLFDREKLGEPVAVYGAGQSGSLLVKTLNQGDEFRPVLLLDDDPVIQGITIGGIRITNPADVDLGDTLSAHDVSRVIFAMPSLTPAEYEKKVECVRRTGVSVQTIPTYAELVSGAAKLEQVRDISISDILGRSVVPPDLELLGKCVTGKVVMVTGAGGSIGSELCRQIINQRPDKLIAVDHGEENLYKLTEELTVKLAESDLEKEIYVSFLCSVNDADAISELMERYKVNTVYHAAAYKHVPIIEAQPEQGMRVNVFGTMSVLDMAIKNHVDNFVLISTDKAVRPTNSMGATKRTAELVLQAKARLQKRTRISMVRFGNVLGSSGSVVPKFKKQIEEGGPITLTDPDITRFFMTIPEAAQLVMQAGSIAKGGDVFVLDMGEPVRIEDLAKSMVRMSGKRLKRDTGKDEDIEILVEGLRPGEKMYEELFITDSHGSTVIPKVFTANEAWINWDTLRMKLDELSYLGNPADREDLRSKLLDLAFYGQPGSEKSIDIDVKSLENIEDSNDTPLGDIQPAAVSSRTI